MKRVVHPRTVFFHMNKLVEVIGIIDKKAIIMRYLREEDKPKCENCGHTINHKFVEVEDSPNFQDAVEPIGTLEEQ